MADRSLPIHPRGAYYVLAQRRQERQPIDFMEYVRALDRIPQTTIADLRLAEHDAFLLTVLIDRRRRVDELRARWIMTDGR